MWEYNENTIQTQYKYYTTPTLFECEGKDEDKCFIKCKCLVLHVATSRYSVHRTIQQKSHWHWFISINPSLTMCGCVKRVERDTPCLAACGNLLTLESEMDNDRHTFRCATECDSHVKYSLSVSNNQ